MRNSILLFVLAVFVMTASGCVNNMFPGGPTPAGIIITNVKGPSQALAVALDPNAKGIKMGTASCGALLGLFAFGDAGTEEAMKNGGITKVHHVDHRVNSVLFGVWLESTTIVYGE